MKGLNTMRKIINIREFVDCDIVTLGNQYDNSFGLLYDVWENDVKRTYVHFVWSETQLDSGRDYVEDMAMNVNQYNTGFWPGPFDEVLLDKTIVR